MAAVRKVRRCEDTCFACCIQTEHEDSHFSIGKEFVHDFADGATHLDGSEYTSRRFVQEKFVSCSPFSKVNEV
jgi:hypothetical protein